MNKKRMNQLLKKMDEVLLIDMMIFKGQNQLRERVILISWLGIEKEEL